MPNNFKIVEPQMGAPSPASLTGTSKQYPLGFLAKGADFQTTLTATASDMGQGVFQYVVGDTAGAPQSAGQLVFLRGHSVFLAGTANRASNFPLGIAGGAISASNVYGWVQVKGLCDYAFGHSAGNFLVGASAFLASTTGNIATTQGNSSNPICGL